MCEKIMGAHKLTVNLPDSLYREADAAGLLKPGVLEQVLRDEIRRRRVGDLFAAAARLSQLAPPLTAAELESEIAAVRLSRRSSDAGSG